MTQFCKLTSGEEWACPQSTVIRYQWAMRMFFWRWTQKLVILMNEWWSWEKVWPGRMSPLLNSFLTLQLSASKLERWLMSVIKADLCLTIEPLAKHFTLVDDLVDIGIWVSLSWATMSCWICSFLLLIPILRIVLSLSLKAFWELNCESVVFVLAGFDECFRYLAALSLSFILTADTLLFFAQNFFSTASDFDDWSVSRGLLGGCASCFLALFSQLGKPISEWISLLSSSCSFELYWVVEST